MLKPNPVENSKAFVKKYGFVALGRNGYYRGVKFLFYRRCRLKKALFAVLAKPFG